VFNILQLFLKFYANHQEFIDNLLSGGLPAIFSAVIGCFWWLRWRHRQRQIAPTTFAFEVIKPQSPDLMRQILGGDDNDPLADRNIVYQNRVENRSIRQELQQQLEEFRWVLILGRTGLGKTREATELAKHLNQMGWTVLYLKPNEWLDTPARMPKLIGSDRKLLFFLDDLNQKMHRSLKEISPDADKSPVERFTIPLQERLLDTLTRYESFCGKAEIRVIATAGNELQPDYPGEPSAWDKLQWDQYPKLWQKFQIYELPEPEDRAIVEVLKATVPKIKILAKPEQFPELARRNDATYRNVVENLQRLLNEGLPLNSKNYRESLGKTWEERYKESVNRFPMSRYVYDAVDLLRQFDIPLYRFMVESTAQILAGGNFWQRLWYRWQVSAATHFLIHTERILYPRDGQIEAKGRHVNPDEYILCFTSLILKLADQHSQELHCVLLNFGVQVAQAGYPLQAIACWDKVLEKRPDYYQAWGNRGIVLSQLGKNQASIASYNKVLEVRPDDYLAWYYRGNVLEEDGQHEEAIASYNQALSVCPEYHPAWNNRGIVLRKLARFAEAIASFDTALLLQPDSHEAWFNRGVALQKLGEWEEAIASFEKALLLKPDLHEAWYKQGNSLFCLKRYEDAVAAFDKAVAVNPNLHEAWFNRGNALGHLGKYALAIASFEQALAIKPDKHEAWNNRGLALACLERYEDAIASYEQALLIKPNDDYIWYNKACCYGLQGNADQAVENLQKAIDLNPKCQEMATNDPDFNRIFEDERFQALIAE
jgi:tetratricopeptide (TPR) repeat protein